MKATKVCNLYSRVEKNNLDNSSIKKIVPIKKMIALIAETNKAEDITSSLLFFFELK